MAGGRLEAVYPSVYTRLTVHRERQWHTPAQHLRSKHAENDRARFKTEGVTEMQRFKNILLVFDPEAANEVALDRAVTLAKKNEAQLTVVKVVAPCPPSVGHLRTPSTP